MVEQGIVMNSTNKAISGARCAGRFAPAVLADPYIFPRRLSDLFRPRPETLSASLVSPVARWSLRTKEVELAIVVFGTLNARWSLLEVRLAVILQMTMFVRPAFCPITGATNYVSSVLSPRILVFPLVDLGKVFVPENGAVLAPAAPSVDLVYKETDHVVGNLYLDIGSSPTLHTNLLRRRLAYESTLPTPRTTSIIATLHQLGFALYLSFPPGIAHIRKGRAGKGK